MTESAVRVTHLPTGVSACAATKSQHRNRQLALAHLRARLSERAREQVAAGQNERRRAQIGSGERSDKIRTVAFQRGRVENHVSGKTMPLERYLRGYVREVQ